MDPKGVPRGHAPTPSFHKMCYISEATLSSEKHVKTYIYVLHVMPDNAEYWPIHLRAFTC